jgi:hypothetical protein
MALSWISPSKQYWHIGTDTSLKESIAAASDNANHSEYTITVLTSNLFFQPQFTGYNLDDILITPPTQQAPQVPAPRFQCSKWCSSPTFCYIQL